MKKILLPLCFAAFLSAGLVSCSDEAAEIIPQNEIENQQFGMTDDETTKERTSRP